MVRKCVLIAVSLGAFACGGKPPAPTPPPPPAEATPPPANPDENRVIDPADNPSAGKTSPGSDAPAQPE